MKNKKKGNGNGNVNGDLHKKIVAGRKSRHAIRMSRQPGMGGIGGIRSIGN